LTGEFPEAIVMVFRHLTFMRTRGIHLIADFWGCSKEDLENSLFLEKMIEEAAGRTGASVRKLDSCKFEPSDPPYSHGVTAYAILGESHIAIHTFPEECFASIDIYTCGDTCDPRRGYEYIKTQLRPTDLSYTELIRGQPNSKSTPPLQKLQ
jgi:S-adenosylmethionine decarboxylase